MALDESLFGGSPADQVATDIAQHYQPDDGQPLSSDPAELSTRLARKLSGSQFQGVDFDKALAKPEKPKKEDAPDLSSFGDEVPEPSTDNLSSFGTEAQPEQSPAQPGLGLSGNLVAAGKGLLRGAPEQVGSIAQGSAALTRPQLNAGGMDLIDELKNVPGMSPGDRAKLVGRALRTFTNRGDQMDFNAAVQRIARGGNASDEADAFQKRFTGDVQGSTLYQRGKALKESVDQAVPMTPEEQASVGGQIGTGISGVAPYVAAGAVNPALGLAAGAAGMGLSTAGDIFNDAKGKGATDDQAVKAAGWGGAIGAALGVLPLGAVFKPVEQAAPGMKSFLAAKLVQAAQSGITFATVGEAQEYLLQKLVKEQYDPNAGYSFDAKRAIASLLTGAIVGAAHPLKEKDLSSPEAIADFIQRAARAGSATGRTPDEEAAFQRGAQTRSDIDEFLRQREQREAAGRPALPAPEQGAPESPTGTEPGPNPSPTGGAPVDDEATLRQFGYDDATIRNMGAGTKRATAEMLRKSYPNGPQGGSSAEQTEIDGLKRHGWTDDEISAMSPATRRQFFQEAMAGEQPSEPSAPVSKKSTQTSIPTIIDKAHLTEKLADKDGAFDMGKVGDYVAGQVQTGLDQGRKVTLYQEGKAIPIVNVARGMMQDAKGQRWGTMSLLAPSPGQHDRVEISGAEPQAAEPVPGTREAPITPETGADVFTAQAGNPTPDQAKAGNYPHVHMELPHLGLTGANSISIETGAGQVRRGVDENGKPWEVTMPFPYGRIKGTKGADGEHLDITVGPNPKSPHVFVIDQHHNDGSGFDEHKIMAGFDTPQEALMAYGAAYDDLGGNRIGHVTAMTPEQFMEWRKGDTTQPLKKTLSAQEIGNLFDEIVGSGEGEKGGEPVNTSQESSGSPQLPYARSDEVTSPEHTGAESGEAGKIEPHEGEIIAPGRVYAEPTQEHHDQIEAVLGADYHHVLPVDVSRAAEILAEKPGITPQLAFQYAVIENAATHNFLTRPQLEQSYGPEVKTLLEPGREGTSGGGEPSEQNGTKPHQKPTIGGEEGGQLQSRGENGPPERAEGATTENGEQPNTGRKQPNAKRKARGGAAEESAGSAEGANESGSLVDAFIDRLKGDGFKNILDARRLAKERGIDDVKQVEETLELAAVKAAREIVDSSKDPYPELVKLYEKQPRLGTRTSTSIRDQAYSTPVPLAYIADRMADITKDTTVYEPTAGNGALLLTADPKKAQANELNPDRAKNLRDQGFEVREGDALTKNTVKRVDRVIANPPFGVVRENGASRIFNLSHIQPGYHTTEIDHAIALHSLDAMKDDGRAALIIGGPAKTARGEESRSNAYNSRAKREFFKTLYDRYNVVDHFTVAGELYERQGAGWPVDVIVINGRGKSARALPAVDVPRIYDSWEALGGLLHGQERGENAGAAKRQAGSAPEERSGLEGNGGPDRGGAGERGSASASGPGRRSGSVGNEPVRGQPEAGNAGANGAEEPGERVRNGRSVRAGEQPPAEQPPSRLSADEIGDIFDELVPEEKPAEPTRGPMAREVAKQHLPWYDRGYRGEPRGGNEAEQAAWDRGALDARNAQRKKYTQADLLEAQQIHREAQWRTQQAENNPAHERFAAQAKAKLDEIERALAKTDKRTTGEVAKSAAKNATSAADDALSALTQLFGGGKTIGSGLNFDEDTYAKAKPLFIQAAEKFADFKHDIRELMKRMIDHLKDAYKWTTDMLRKARPYVVRFIQDVQDGAVNLLKPKAEEPKPAEQPAPKRESKAVETAGQAKYQPKSEKPGLDTLVPVNMKTSIENALTGLEKRVGKIDDFVAKELGYDKADLEKYFGAEQVDALGLAIDNLNKGKGFIIGDQTGIGKGRVNAAIIKWAMRKGRIPVFTTEKPGLYADMFRDMTDIGMEPPRIMATNASLSMPLDDAGKVWLKSADSKKHNALMGSLGSPEEFKKQFDMVFTNYSQMQTVKGGDTARRSFLRAIMRNSVIIFDESHNAGGQAKAPDAKNSVEDRADFARSLVRNANGVFYSSATYAKRPDVMSLYAATDMAMAVDNIDSLGEAIARGGIPMQQGVAAMLSKAGQYIRRERSFHGINYNTPSVGVNHDTYDQISHALKAIQDFSDKHVKGATKDISRALKAEAMSLGGENAVGSAGASSTNFTSIMHNIINQMLLAMKVPEAAKMAIRHIQNGEKPVLTVANTMESFLTDYANELGISPGDEIDADFADVLMKYLDRSRRISIRKPFSKEKAQHHVLTDEELGPLGLQAYHDAKALIASMDLAGMPISPIDYLKGELEKAGYNVGEITGRGLTVDYSGKRPVLKVRPGGETTTKGRNEMRRRFNLRPEKNGLHAIIINQAGSTGISMHAGERFDDKSKRRMMIVQPEANIDTHMQLLGRVNRTGQVVLPEYDQLVANIPAEKRPAAVLAKKMASLNANTTASRTSAVTAKDVPDFMNQYGDMVAAAYLSDNPDMNERMGWPVKPGENGLESDGAMRKLTGRIPLLPLKRQEDLYKHLEDEYAGLIQQMEASGTSPLEAKTLDLKARTLETSEVQGAKNNSGSPFAAPVNVDKVSVLRQGKPFKPEEIIKKLADRLGIEAPATTDEWINNHLFGRGDAVKNSSDIETKERHAKVKEFDDYARALLNLTEDDPKQQESDRNKLNAIKDRWTSIHTIVPIGARVRLNMAESSPVGIVLDVKQNGEPRNPLALGSWKVTFAVADASRQITLPFSRLFLQGQANPDSAIDVEVVPTRETAKDTLARFEMMQSGAREERYIATGNLLAAYDWLNMKGAIINYTDSQGAVHQGILTAKDFELGKHAIARGRVVHDPNELKTLLDQNQTLWSKDRQVNLSRAWSDSYEIQAEKKKATGGRYYLDPDLLKLVDYGNFTSRGGMMNARVRGKDLPAAIQRLQELGAQFTVAAAAPKAQKVEQPPEPPDDEPPGGGKMASMHSPEDFYLKGAPPEAANANASQEQVKAMVGEPLSRRERDWQNYGKHMSPDDVLHSEVVWGAARRGEDEGLGGPEEFAAAANDLWRRMGANRHITPELAKRFMRVEEAKANGIKLAERDFAGVKLTPEAEKLVGQIEQRLSDIVQRVAGPDVQVTFNDGLIDLPNPPGYNSKSASGKAAGAYIPARSVIELALLPGQGDAMRDTAYHESYHHIEDKLSTEAERKIMEAETPRLRSWIKGKTGLSDPEVDKLAGYEVRAIAFQLYGGDRDAGRSQAGSGIHILVRRFFDRLLDLLHQVRNALRGLGFKSAKDIFNEAYEGNFAGRKPHESAIDLNSMAADWRVFRRQQNQAVQDSLRDVLSKASRWDKFREKGQDLNIFVNRLQDAVQARMEGELPDSKAFAQKKKLFPGKVATEVQDFNKNHLDPLVDLLKEKGVSLDDIGDIVYAQHAAERNAYIDTINPGANGMGSGMSNDEAQAILDRYSAHDLAEINNRIDGIRDFILDTMERSGLESRTTTDAWRAQYEHYVPLGGFAEPREDDVDDIFRESGKFNVRGREVKQAFGRRSKADNPLINLLDQAYRTIERGKKNEYLRALTRALLGLEPEDRKGFVQFDRGKPRREIDPRTGLVRTVDDSSYRFSPNAVAYKVGGNTHYMVFDQRAMAEVLKRMHPDALNGFGQALLTLQNKLKASWTHWSPEFMIRHFLFRYPIEGTLNSFEQGNVPRYMADSIPFMGRASRAIFASNRGEVHPDPETAQYQRYWEEMRQHGGAMAFRQSRDIDMTRDHLERRLQSLTGRPLATVRDKARAVSEAVDTVTNALDNSLRLSAYAEARRQGKTPEQASVIARDATVDYQQAGKWKNYIGMIWPFSNVAAQTGTRMASAMTRSRTMRAVFAGSVAAGFMSGMFNYLIGGNDTDGTPFFDKIPWWQKQLHLTVLSPFHDGKGRPVPIHIPLPYNWAFPFTIGQAMATMAFSKTRGEVRRAIAATVKSGLDAFSAFAEDANWISTFAPELAKVPVRIGTNENWTGYPIHLNPDFQKGPRSASGYKTTGEGWKFAASMANAASGGDKHHAGYLDFFPEDLREMTKYYTGLGTIFDFGRNATETAQSAVSGKPVDYSKMPLARVVMGTDYDAANRSRQQENRRLEKRPWER